MENRSFRRATYVLGKKIKYYNNYLPYVDAIATAVCIRSNRNDEMYYYCCYIRVHLMADFMYIYMYKYIM